MSKIISWFFLVPFSIAIIISIWNRKAGYVALAISSVILLAGFSTIENNGAILAAIGFYMIAQTAILRDFSLVVIVICSLSHSLSKTGLFLGTLHQSGAFSGEFYV